MLQLKNIVKTYVTGDLRQDALQGVSISFRENEFVSVLGQSGSGKTTLLNIIGGLDRYTSGDLVINGVSTKKYRDSDWDFYRNNSIGFVFQSYNLIPHQSVLANVELALTLAGVSKKERRRRAVAVLERVGLKEHIHKRPNQMSGGQMQRVAIARALINDPDILLADEPTGALDSETSLQIMELLKEIAKDKLVIMVTHNPDLAQQYSTRLVRLLDGKIVSDSNPCEDVDPSTEPLKKHKRISMSFFTALSLSFNNLRTKKGRTLLTAFAGSIGIIGIALILSLSNGINTYISNLQRETMTSYPISITAEAMDVSGMMGGELSSSMQAGMVEEEQTDRTGVYADYQISEVTSALDDSIKENNLSAFKKYLDDPDSEIRQYLGENGVAYSYAVDFSVYSYDAEGILVDSAADTDEINSSSSSAIMSIPLENMQKMRELVGGSGTSGAENFSELMAGPNGESVSPILTDSYEILYGDWPQEYDEVILVLDRDHTISAETLYQLGLITAGEYEDDTGRIEAGETVEERTWDYENVCQHKFYMVPACDHYTENEDGTFTPVDDADKERLLENAVELKITGVIRPVEDAANANISTAIAYTSKLTDYVIRHTDESAVVQAQEKSPEINVLNGMEFNAADNAKKVEDAKAYLSGLGVSEKASFYTMVLYRQSQEEKAESNESQEQIGQSEGASQMFQDGQSAGSMGAGMAMDETSLAAALDQWLETDPDQELLLSVYDEYIDGASYEDNLKAFGKVSYDAPSAINIYTDSFEDKEAIDDLITAYNEGVEEKDRIVYTDYVALLMSGVTTMINAVSYGLIAFVSVSLIVSCIMIGIITYISVLERTKEIGILRSVGASKKDVSRVFNAETVIVGLAAGLIGVGVTALLNIPISILLEHLTGIGNIAVLPLVAAVILVAISVGLTMLAGLIPARFAAKKDPVIALRTE